MMNINNTNTNKLKKHYDNVYESEKTGLINLNLKRFPKNRWEAIIHCFPLKAHNVLEIGCGNGIILHNIADRCDMITGIEISESRCEIARKNLSDLKLPVEIIQANIEEKINKSDGIYDVIIWADVIEHVVDIFSSMKEISRLLTIGGTLITSTPNFGYFRYRLFHMFGKFPSTAANNEGFSVRANEMYDGGHLHYFTFNTLKTFYEMNMIKPIKTLGFGRCGYFHNIWPSLFSGSVLIVGEKIEK